MRNPRFDFSHDLILNLHIHIAYVHRVDEVVGRLDQHLDHVETLQRFLAAVGRNEEAESLARILFPLKMVLDLFREQ